LSYKEDAQVLDVVEEPLRQMMLVGDGEFISPSRNELHAST